MILIQLQGGLGNQLFQYSAALLASKDRPKRILVDSSYYFYVRNRRYILDKLHLPAKKISVKMPLELPLSLPFFGKHWERIYSSLGRYDLYHEKRPFYVDKNLWNLKKPTYLFGFWQHRAYVDDVEDSFTHLLRFPRFVQSNSALLDKIQSSDSVALHVRRGDFVRANVSVCSENYYRDAMKYISSKVKSPHYYVFSDDISWCKRQFGVQKDITFIENLDDEIASLHLMSLCEHHIIANSTFSWWGARLKTRQGIVVAPKDWCGNIPAGKSLLYDEWIKLPQ